MPAGPVCPTTRFYTPRVTALGFLLEKIHEAIPTKRLSMKVINIENAEATLLLYKVGVRQGTKK